MITNKPMNIKIQALENKFRTEEDLSILVSRKCKIEPKFDGIKLNIIKTNVDTPNNWTVTYKGDVYVPGEFDYQAPEDLETTVGLSQLKFVMDHFSGLSDEFPIGTELFCEFIMKKPTLMSNYGRKSIVLLGVSKASTFTQFGRMFVTGHDHFQYPSMEEVAETLKLDTPGVMFEGSLYPVDELISGVKDEVLFNLIKQNEFTLRSLQTDVSSYFNHVKGLLLSVPSKFGGNEEGVVIKNDFGVFKIQQDYQLDKVERFNKKSQFIEDTKELESIYQAKIHSAAMWIADQIRLRDPERLNTGLKMTSALVSGFDDHVLDGLHTKKNLGTIKDDIHYLARQLYLRSIPGNNAGLIMGKFRILTNGHARMIEKAIENCDTVYVGVISSRDSKHTAEMRKRAILAAYPEVKVFDLVSANLNTALRKVMVNVNHVFTGSDRFDDYLRQSKKYPGLSVTEIRRTEESVSATKVIENISDLEYFYLSTPVAVHNMHREYVSTYL